MSQRIEFVEIDIPKCQRTYGVAPCTAEVGVTGSEKCFNCRATCQDLENISESDETLRFAKTSTLIPSDIDAIPNVSSVSYAPPELKLGESIGVRSSISVSFKDHRSPDTDASGDNYISDRNYDPYSQGTYFGKLRARYPSLQGMKLRWIVGTPSQLVEDMETRHFIIDAVAGPDVSGNYQVTAKDVLRLTSGDQSVAPFITDRSIDQDLTNSQNNFIILSFNDDDPLYQEALDNQYLNLGGVEIVGYTTQLVSGGVILTVTSRGQLNTEAVAHSEDDSLQIVKSYSGDNPEYIFYDLLTTYASIDPSFISLLDWQNESSTYINRTYTANIAEPTAVVSLINELLEQTASTMWWDSQAQLIRWEVLKQPNTSASTYNDSNTIQGSFNIADDYSKRVSRCYIYFGQINPLKKLDERDNYAVRTLRTELDSELLFNGKPSYKRIFSRWITETGLDTADQLGDLILQRYSLPPRKIGFRLLRDSGVEIPELGGAYNASNYELQDFAGRTSTLPIQITSLIPSNTTWTVKAEEITFNQVIAPVDPNTRTIVFATNQNNVNLRDVYDQNNPAPDSDTVLNVTINTGIIIGSLSTSTPAFTTGEWPAGVTINITNNGKIVGRGGSGGTGATIEFIRPSVSSIAFNTAKTIAGGDGGDGGDAFEALFDVNLDNDNGLIGGGGGGGGGGGVGFGRVRFLNLTTDPSANRPFISYWAYAAGAGGSGGAGSISGGGASSGTINAISGGNSASYQDSYTNPQSSFAGSLESGGSGRPGGVGSNVIVWSKPPTETTVTYTITAGSSGSGGDLGQSGSAGGSYTTNLPDGVYNPGLFNEFETDSDDRNYASGGSDGYPGSGGSPGRAIVQNGATVNIINSGDIRGAIV